MIIRSPYFFKRLPYFKGRYTEVKHTFEILFKFFEDRIEDHNAEIDFDDPATDYVGAYLKEKDKKDRLGEQHGYSMMQLNCVCFDMWVAGQETTSTTTAWGVNYLIHNEKAQEQLHEELDRVIGSDRQITVADRPFLPFTNAVINETQRVCNLVPQNLLHKTTKDVTIDGYFIPKGTCIIPQVSAVLYDEEIFKDATKFNPGRFLDADGQLKKCEQLIPFSIGKRQCLGEALARMELFLFIANIFNQFKITPAAEMPSLKRNMGITVHCPSFTCKMEKRHHN